MEEGGASRSNMKLNGPARIVMRVSEPKLPPPDPDPDPGSPAPRPNPDEPGPDIVPQIDPDNPEPQRM
jgi:hypothetical protein